MYRRQCSRCLLWLQLTLHLFDKPPYYSRSLCSLKAASTLQVIYHKIIYCTLTWKTKISEPIQNYIRLAVFDFFFFACGRTSSRQAERYRVTKKRELWENPTKIEEIQLRRILQNMQHTQVRQKNGNF